jgi:cation transport regulator ChaB
MATVPLKLKAGRKGPTRAALGWAQNRAQREAPKQIYGCLLNPSQEKKDDEDDQDDADDTDAAVTVAVAVAAEPAAESAEQEDDEDDDEDKSERHDAVLSFQRREKFKGCESREGHRGDGRDGSEKPRRLLKPRTAPPRE